MSIRIQSRRGTESEWVSADPVLASGELAYSTDTEQLKLGNGVDVWSDIEYIGALPEQSGSEGLFLTTNGASVSWGVVDLSTKADINSPTFTGTPAAPTAAARTNTTQLATTAFVYEEMNKVSVDTKTASYTLAVADAGKVIEMDVASENNLTIPLNSSVAIPIGTTVDIVQYGAGQTTLVPTSGVTVRSKEGALKLTGQYSAVSLYKRGTNEWVAVGDLSA